jgi:hypothetical protein
LGIQRARYHPGSSAGVVMQTRNETEEQVLSLLRSRARDVRDNAKPVRLVVEIYPPRKGSKFRRTRVWWDENVRGWEAASPDFLSDLKPPTLAE